MQFLSQVKQEHANMVHTAHLVVGGILKIDLTYFHSNTNHANVPELKELLRDTRKLEQDFPLLAVIP